MLLFTTQTCPNCKIAKRFLDASSIAYAVVDAQQERALAMRYDIMQAPTLVVLKDGVATSYTNASAIKAYAEKVC